MIDLTQELVRALASPEAAESIKAIVREALKEQLQADNETLLDTAQVADLLAMTPAAVRKAAERGTITCERVGRQLRFRRSKLPAK